MSKERLKPFNLAGLLDHCPECGARGSYDLLTKRVLAVKEAWERASGFPDTQSERVAIELAIDKAVAAIGMERA